MSAMNPAGDFYPVYSVEGCLWFNFILFGINESAFKDS